MTMTPRMRKFALTTHVTSSIGWFGAVATFVALAIAGMISQDAQMLRAAYLAMELTTWFVIVPLAFISLLSGVVTSLGTNWGLFRYYWVLLKLLITVLATIVLLVHLQPIDLLAGAAAKTTVFSADLQSLQLLMVTASSAALVVLIVLAVLSVYKPRGMTQFGLRKQRALSQPTAAMRPCSDGGDASQPVCRHRPKTRGLQRTRKFLRWDSWRRSVHRGNLFALITCPWRRSLKTASRL